MEESKLQKFIHNIKNKFKNNSKVDPFMNEYAFSSKELDELKKDNIEKIKELKREIKEKKKKEEVLNEKELNESILNENTSKEQSEENEEQPIEEENKDNEEQEKNSFINLNKEYQDLIMSKWKTIDLNLIDKDIMIGKDLLNHNYTITYADDAAEFIQDIRKKYEVVLCYLIGFNNEKKEIYNKTIFSDSIDNEWKYLNYYIKLLEKIRNFKMN